MKTKTPLVKASCVFSVRVASIRLDLLRSWVGDTAGICDVDFEWHELAKVWQASGAGE